MNNLLVRDEKYIKVEKSLKKVIFENEQRKRKGDREVDGKDQHPRNDKPEDFTSKRNGLKSTKEYTT